jgi:4-diphosphocytidyl-2-C-methyl-D-erythritol kinase
VDRLTLSAPAKLNLRLLVGRLQPDGYHPIRSLMIALDGLDDTVTVRRAAQRAVRCEGLDGDANLAWRALDALEADVGRRLPCVVEIDKRIPTQAGLGGGSSDAAATLVGVNQIFNLGLGDARLERIAAAVGSDAPFFIRGGAQWAEGRGERLIPASAPTFAAVIVKPPFGLATADVYREFDRLPSPRSDDGGEPSSAMPELGSWLRNVLWDAAVSLQPELRVWDERLRAAGSQATLLCGSGSALAGVCADAASAAAVHAALGDDLAFLVSARATDRMASGVTR